MCEYMHYTVPLMDPADIALLDELLLENSTLR